MLKLVDRNKPAPAQRSEKQREAARLNGAKTRGPVTPEGKRNSSLNGLRHNLCSVSLVLSNEDRPGYRALLDSYIAEYRPCGPTQMDLIEQMAAAKWREKRAWSLEAATLDYAMDEMEPRMAARFESSDQPTRAALAFADRTENSNALMLLHRYEARHTRVWRAALRQLIELQRASSPTRTPDRQRREKQNLPAEPGHLHDSKKAA